MTLDEAIKHAEEVVEENEKFCFKEGGKGGYFNEGTDWDSTKCAAEHRQLAEWLKDYKRLLEQEPRKGKWISRWYVGHDLHFHVCSECNEEFSCDMETGISIDNYRYCPNCGADMREVKE